MQSMTNQQWKPGATARSPVVTLRRPEVRNAVDGPTALALYQAVHGVRRRSPMPCVAVFHGDHGPFLCGLGSAGCCPGAGTVARCCAGPGVHAGLRPCRVAPVPAPMGPIAAAAVQAGDRRRQRRGRRRRHGAGALVRPAGDGAGCLLWHLLPAFRRAADRWRNGAAATPDRHGPRDGPDPDRAQVWRRPEALQMGLCNRVVASGSALWQAALELAAQLASVARRPRCVPTAQVLMRQWDLPLPQALHQEWERGKTCLDDALQGDRPDSPPGPGGTARPNWLAARRPDCAMGRGLPAVVNRPHRSVKPRSP
jgi:enoyl-CoA hydratase